MDFTARDLPAADCYRLLTGAVAPRPIAWVTSLSAGGVVNAAPFSFFTALSTQLTKPPMLAISVGPKPGGAKKDTVRNIEAGGEFVVHVVSEDLLPAMVQTSLDYPDDVSEVTAVGLELAPGQSVAVPHLVAAPVHMECRLLHFLALGEPPVSLIIGEVLRFGVRDEVLQNGRIDPYRLQPVGRLGGSTYCRMRDLFDVRPNAT